jgi:glutamine amidotransferase
MITIIDYGVGNISALENVYKRLNVPTRVARTEKDLENAEKLILPGVGAFDFAMTRLNNSGMRDRLDDLVLTMHIPVIGICVGMQIMGQKSEEGNLDGLGWVNADILKFDEKFITHRAKLPHMGWNDVECKTGHPLFTGLEQKAIFYFLHSFYFQCHDDENSIATANYGVKFTSAINKKNIYGVQFHPEKSHQFGETLLKNFSKI